MRHRLTAIRFAWYALRRSTTSTDRARQATASITRSELAGQRNASSTTRRPSHRRGYRQPRPRPPRSRWAAGAFEAPRSVVIPRHRDRYTLPQIGFARPTSMHAFRRALVVVAGPYITRAPPGGERRTCRQLASHAVFHGDAAGIMSRKALVAQRPLTTGPAGPSSSVARSVIIDQRDGISSRTDK